MVSGTSADIPRCVALIDETMWLLQEERESREGKEVRGQHFNSKRWGHRRPIRCEATIERLIRKDFTWTPGAHSSGNCYVSLLQQLWGTDKQPRGTEAENLARGKGPGKH